MRVTRKSFFHLLAVGLLVSIIGCGGGQVKTEEAAPAKEPAYKIGDTGPGGGIVFFNEGGQYKECSGEELGLYNWHDALRAAQSFRGGDFTDWRLPSQDELNLIYQNLHTEGVGEFFGGWYWSASQNDDNTDNAWKQNFNNSNQSDLGKLNASRVRAVRVFEEN